MSGRTKLMTRSGLELARCASTTRATVSRSPGRTRTKQIGTRRALGARRRDIIDYFLVENALITGAGILMGCLLALAAGYWLSLHYALPRLNLYYLVGGVLALWGIGQLAAWQPARRASAVPPSVATRTV